MNTRKQLIEEIRAIIHLLVDEEFDKVMESVKDDSLLIDKLNKLKEDKRDNN